MSVRLKHQPRAWRGEVRDRYATAPRRHLGAETDFVYFIQAESGGPIKIGRSRLPHDRLKRLQTAHPERLVIRRQVAVHTSASRRMEGRIHEHFDHARVRGEWFSPVPELVKLARAVG